MDDATGSDIKIQNLDESVSTLFLTFQCMDVEEHKADAIKTVGTILRQIKVFVPGMENLLPKLVKSLDHPKVSIQVESILTLISIAARRVNGPNSLKLTTVSSVDFEDIFRIELIVFDKLFVTLQRVLLKSQTVLFYTIKRDILKHLLVIIRSYLNRKHYHVIAIMLYYIFKSSVALTMEYAKDALHLFQALLGVADIPQLKLIIRGLRELIRHPARIVPLHTAGILSAACKLIVHKNDDIKKLALKFVDEASVILYVQINPEILLISPNNVHNLLRYGNEKIRRRSLMILYHLTDAKNGLSHQLVVHGLIPSILYRFNENGIKSKYFALKVIKNITVYANSYDVEKLIDTHVIPVLCEYLTGNANDFLIICLSSIYNMLRSLVCDTFFALRDFNALDKIQMLQIDENCVIRNLSKIICKHFLYLVQESISDA
ncbi:uncharacterized protein LOC119661825 [Teleopsis dalmanni]|uniref:uncharacterized protein LOC119661825 n=1 Tax=Teleopsis dalmanni TaxID=139649 RepID=UPI0018CD0441|nr:uncharacterized protein LOC119661825 [Teleopsis dalmanni]